MAQSAAPAVGTFGATVDPTFSIDAQSKLDLQDNDLVIHTGSTDANGQTELANVQSLAAIGRRVAPGGNLYSLNVDPWSGNGLTSSTAAAADAATAFSGDYAPGVKQNDFAFGDVNGDGYVDGLDATAFSGLLYGLGTPYAAAGQPAVQL